MYITERKYKYKYDKLLIQWQELLVKNATLQHQIDSLEKDIYRLKVREGFKVVK